MPTEPITLEMEIPENVAQWLEAMAGSYRHTIPEAIVHIIMEAYESHIAEVAQNQVMHDGFTGPVRLPPTDGVLDFGRPPTRSR